MFGGARHHLNSYSQAEQTHKFLMRMRTLIAHTSSWCVCSVHASVPDAYAQHVWWNLCSVHAQVPDAYAQCTHKFLMRMLSARISSWCVISACISYWCICSACLKGPLLSALITTRCVCSVHASVPDVYAQCTLRFLMHMISMFDGTFAQCTRKYLMRMLSARISFWCVWSVHASVPEASVQHVWRDLCSVHA